MIAASTTAPDFAAMPDRAFDEAMMEFVGLCDPSHPHWTMWADEQARRRSARRNADKAALRHLSPAYVDMAAQAA